MNDGDRDIIQKQLLLNIAELLEEEGFISNEEKKRMRNIINAQPLSSKRQSLT